MKFDFGSTNYVSFNYGNLHNNKSYVDIFSPEGALLAREYLVNSGTTYKESQMKNFSWQAATGQKIGYIQVNSSEDPDEYYTNWLGWKILKSVDVGWVIDTITWGLDEKASNIQAAHTYEHSNFIATPNELHIIDLPNWLINGQSLETQTVSNLFFDGENQVIDFSTIVQRVSGLQKVDLTGKGDNMLKLDAESLLSQGEQGLFIDNATRQFMIDGDAGDRITLEQLDLAHGWQKSSGNVDIGGKSWLVIENQKLSFSLLIDDEIELVYV